MRKPNSQKANAPKANAEKLNAQKTATPPQPETRRLTPLEWLDGASLALLVVAMCSQIDLGHVGQDTLAAGLGYATKILKLAISDAFFALTVLYFTARTIQLKAWKRLWWPPLPCWALIFALVVSFLHSPTIWAAVAAEHKPITKESKEAIAEIIQWAGYFLVAPWVLVNLLIDRRGQEPILRRELAVRALFFGALASAIVALVQWQQLDQSITLMADANLKKPVLPRGNFLTPNVYAGFLAVVVPFLAEAETDNERHQSRFWLLALVCIVVSIVTVVSFWALAAMVIGLLVALMVRPGDKTVRMFRIGLVTALAVAIFTFYSKPGRLAVARHDFARVGSVNQQVKKQYVEWQVASRWNAPRERAFATGVGPGNYQLNIGPLYFDGLPNEEKMPPDSNNLWLVQAMSIGVLGLGALLWMVTYFMGLAWRGARENGDWLGAAVTAALSSWVVVNFFHALVVRGAGLVLALLFAFAVVASGKVSNETPVERVLGDRES